MLPDRVTVHLAGVSEAALDLRFWDDVYGFAMQPVRQACPSQLAACRHALCRRLHPGMELHRLAGLPGSTS